MIIPLLKSRLFKNASVYTVVNILDKLIPFLILPLLTRELSQEAIGYYVLYQAILPVIMLVLTLNADSSVLLSYYKLENEKFNNYLSNSFYIIIGSYILFGSLLLVFGEHIAAVIEFPAIWLFLAFNVVALRFITTLKLNLWQVQKRPIPYGIYRVSYTLVVYTLALILILVYNFSWQGIIIGQLVGGFIFSIIALFIFIKNKYFDFKINLEFIIDNLKVGLPLSIHNLGAWFGNLASRFVINLLIGKAATGSYGIGATFGIIMLVLQDSFNKAFVPFLFEKLENLTVETKIKLAKYTYLYYGSILILAGLISVFGYYTIGLIFGENYIDARNIIAPVVFANAFNGMYKMHVNYVFFTKNTQYIAVVTFISGAVNIILCYLFVQQFYIAGAAYAYLISQIVSYLLAFYIGYKFVKIPYLYFLK